MENLNTLKIWLMKRGVTGAQAAEACHMTKFNFYRLYYNAVAPTSGRGWTLVRGILKRRYEIVYDHLNGWHFQTEVEKEVEKEAFKRQVNMMFGKEILE